jgi:polyisoprenoid-binding protein YceI
MTRVSIWFCLACLLAAGLARGQVAPLDAAASSIKFTGHAFLHDFTGEAHTLSGSAQLDAKAPQVVTGATLVIQAAGMTTFEKTRDRNMETWLHANANPTIVFTLDQVKLFSGEPRNATASEPARFTVKGELQLNRHQHAVNDMADGWRSGSTLVVAGTTAINTEDFGLPQVRQFFLTVDPKVDIAYRLVFDVPSSFQLPPPVP